MTKEKFTPGEWHIWKDNSTIPFIFDKDGYAIACMCGKQKDYSVISCLEDYLEPEKVQANAHLIAAAPEMYALLKMISAPTTFMGAKTDEVLRTAIEAVLKKARGEENE